MIRFLLYVVFSSLVIISLYAQSNLAYSNNTKGTQSHLAILDFITSLDTSVIGNSISAKLLGYKLKFINQPIAAGHYTYTRHYSWSLYSNFLTRNREYIENLLLDSTAFADLSIPVSTGKAFDHNLYAYKKPLLAGGENDKSKSLIVQLSTPKQMNDHSSSQNRASFKHYYYDTVSSQYQINIASVPIAVTGLSTVGAAAHDLHAQIQGQLAANESFNWRDIHWGQVIASGIASGVSTSYVLVAEKRNAPSAQNSFTGLMMRHLISGGTQIGAHSLGFLYDAKKHGFNPQEQLKIVIPRSLHAFNGNPS